MMSRTLSWVSSLLACVAGACAALDVAWVTVIAILAAAVVIFIAGEILTRGSRYSSRP
jgi:hypothetical protein